MKPAAPRNRHGLLEAIASHADAAPNHTAIISPDDKWNWAALHSRIAQVATALIQYGLNPGDRVVIAGNISANYIAAIFGICAVGGVVAPMPMFITRRDADTLLNDSGPEIILADQAGVDLLGEHQKIYDLTQFGGQNAERKLPVCAGLAAERPMSLIYSSGTTGRPKGIIHNMAARDAYGSIFAREYGIDQTSVTLLATAPYSNGTWMMMMPTIFAGGTLVIDSDLKTESIPDQITRHDVTHAFLVPTQLGLLFPPDRSPIAEHALTIVSAGSVLPPDLKRRLHETSFIRLFELYGNTEGVCTILRPEQMEKGLDSVGTPVETGSIAILNCAREAMPVGEIGEIAGANILLSDGYFGLEQLNSELFWQSSDGTPPNNTRFVRSGDLGEIDEHGFLHLRGRIKDMIISGGANVYPEDIEAELRQHPDVADAAVIGRPHSKWGEIPYAFLLLEPGSTATAEDIIAWANNRLGRYQRLRGAQICPEFPRNALGKVMKPLLKPEGVQT